MSEGNVQQTGRHQAPVEQKSSMKNILTAVIFLIALIAILWLTYRNPQMAGNIFIVAIGFGAVIFTHELGHFIVAKLGGIKVEAFAIGFPPLLAGVKKTRKGWRIRLLPKVSGDDSADEQKDKSDEIPTAQKTTKDSDTEYCIGLIPFGGFVKMTGQDDTGPVEQTLDPRSFTNKPIPIRIAVVSAGVVFNIISAVIIYIAVFLIGINIAPPVVGYVEPGSPADIAGIMPRDRIIGTPGRKFLEFSDISLAAALSAKGRTVTLVVQRADGATENVNLIADQAKDSTLPIRTFGITHAQTLRVEPKITNPQNIKDLYDLTGMRPGDVVKAVNGQAVTDLWQMQELVKKTLAPSVVLAVSRTDSAKKSTESARTELELFCQPTVEKFGSEPDLVHFYSLVPRLKVQKDTNGVVATPNGLINGDVILKAGQIENPDFQELRDETTRYEDKEMSVVVLRKDSQGIETVLTVSVTPKKMPNGRVVIGFTPALDTEHPVIARTIDIKNGPAALDIPRGATITRVDGNEVKNFYDIARIIRSSQGQRISIEYRLDDETAGSAGLNIPQNQDHITAYSALKVAIPFEFLREKIKAGNPAQAVKMGMRKTYSLVAQSYLTLRRIITGDVSSRALTGPVGIFTASYQIASYSFIDYIYFLGLISSGLAVINFLPLPITDGGLAVLLIIEKIKGSPINRRTVEIITYIGLAFFLSLFLWVTYNDILRIFFSR